MEVKMKKLIIAAAMVLTSATVADAGGLKCEIVQVLPGIFLPQCTTYDRYAYRGHYQDNYDRRGYYDRGYRHNRYAGNYTRYDRDYYDRNRRPHLKRDIYDRPYRRDGHRW